MIFFDCDRYDAFLLADNMLYCCKVFPCQPAMRHDHNSNHPVYSLLANPLADPFARRMRLTIPCFAPLYFTVSYRHLPALICKGLTQFFRNGNRPVLPARAPHRNR